MGQTPHCGDRYLFPFPELWAGWGCSWEGDASLQGLFEVWRRKAERESWNGLAVNESGTERSWGGSQKEQFVDAQRVWQLGRVWVAVLVPGQPQCGVCIVLRALILCWSPRLGFL